MFFNIFFRINSFQKFKFFSGTIEGIAKIKIVIVRERNYNFEFSNENLPGNTNVLAQMKLNKKI